MENEEKTGTGVQKRTVQRTSSGKRPVNQGKRKKSRRRRRNSINIQYIIAGVIALLVVIVLIFGIKSCGSSNRSAEGAVKALMESYGKKSEKKIKKCYTESAADDQTLQKEITATMKYFDVHNMKGITVVDTGILSQKPNYTYVYVVYTLDLDNEQKYPCVGTYIVGKEDNKYYVLPPSKINDEMSKQAASDYAKFMTSNAYKNYLKEYETFIKKNPGYEERIAGKLGS